MKDPCSERNLSLTHKQHKLGDSACECGVEQYKGFIHWTIHRLPRCSCRHREREEDGMRRIILPGRGMWDRDGMEVVDLDLIM